MKTLTYKSPGSDKEILQFVLENNKGTQIKLLNYGGIITNFLVRLSDGNRHDIVLGFDNPISYLGEHPCFGAIVGRYANRIANGTFQLNDTRYKLAQNNGNHHLHGGIKGFDKVFWEHETLDGQGEEAIRLSYMSKDGEEGYPGNLKANVSFILTDDDELHLMYDAESDQPTFINLTHHDYFNLGDCGVPVYRHEARFAAGHYLEVDEGLIPTGTLLPVQHTPFDFLSYKPIGDDISQIPPGYDHCFVFMQPASEKDSIVSVRNPDNGLMLEMMTTEPGMQFYTGNFLDGSLTGKNGIAYQKHSAFCLEAQHFPDSPNHPSFPSTLLLPGDKYCQKTVYRIRNNG